MSVFHLYAAYYDLLYRDKDYGAESKFVLKLIHKYLPHAKSVLELGSGTGGHAMYLADAGLSVHGVDISEHMLCMAEKKKSTLPDDQQQRLQFSRGDVRSVSFANSFDCVVALFHVLSYQVENQDVLAMLHTAKRHLRPGGVFIFDCWYGPAVLTDRPTVRTKRLEDASISVERLAEPIMHPNKNVVDVNYTVSITNKGSAKVEKFRETHRMRYFFRPELELMVSSCGFVLLGTQEWMTGKDPGFDTWSICFVLRG